MSSNSVGYCQILRSRFRGESRVRENRTHGLVGEVKGRRPGRTTFTLVELLVVITIISILAGMLLPVLAKARRAAKKIACMSRIKQIGVGMTLYHSHYHDWFMPKYVSSSPSYLSWEALLSPYLGIPKSAYAPPRRTVFVCPCDWIPRTESVCSPASYALSAGTNWHNGLAWANGSTWSLGSIRMSRVRSPSACPMSMEYWSNRHRLWNSSSTGLVAASFTNRNSGYHDQHGGTTFIFCDQHVKFVTPGSYAYNGPAIKYGDWNPLTP